MERQTHRETVKKYQKERGESSIKKKDREQKVKIGERERERGAEIWSPNEKQHLFYINSASVAYRVVWGTHRWIVVYDIRVSLEMSYPFPLFLVPRI